MNRLMQTHVQTHTQTKSRPRTAQAERSRRHYTLADKLAIVRESQQPGVSQASISRKHDLGKNVLWTWRKSLAGFSLETPSPTEGDSSEQEVQNLRQKIAELERLLGQKAFEIELLRSRLQNGMRSSNLDMLNKGAP